MCSHLLADVQDVCDRIAILHDGELKELGRVDSLLKVRDETQIRARGLSEAAQAEIRAVVERQRGRLADDGQSDDHARRVVFNDRSRQRGSARPARQAREVVSRRAHDEHRPNHHGQRRSPMAVRPVLQAFRRLPVEHETIWF